MQAVSEHIIWRSRLRVRKFYLPNYTYLRDQNKIVHVLSERSMKQDHRTKCEYVVYRIVSNTCSVYLAVCNIRTKIQRQDILNPYVIRQFWVNVTKLYWVQGKRPHRLGGQRRSTLPLLSLLLYFPPVPFTLKRPGCEVIHSPPVSAEVENTWVYISTAPFVFKFAFTPLPYVNLHKRMLPGSHQYQRI
jgi:hypothetical protein